MPSSVIVMLVLVCVSGRVLSCVPCNCSLDKTGGWSGFQVARCENAGFSSVPSTDTMPANTQVLYIGEGSTIPTINNDQFVSFTKLLEIYVHSSKVNKVERNAFRNMTDVTIIQLEENLLTELPVGLLSHTPRLVEVSFYKNKLKIIPEALFSNLNDLKKVWLNYNEITSIEANCFVNVPRLEKVYLSNNKLTTLSLNIFDESSSLKVLILSYNPWHCDESLCGVMAAAVNHVFLSDGACATPQSLQGKEWSELKGHAVLLQCLPPPDPCRLSRRNVARCSTPLNPARPPLTLPRNITHLHITGQRFTTLENNAFSVYGQLQELHVKRNSILDIKPLAFFNLSHLNVIILSNNKLNNLVKDIFTPTVNVSKILLNGNQIRRLDNFMFANLVMLKEVNLSFNNISFIDDECFFNVPSLRSIDLSNNQLQTLQLNVLTAGVNLERLFVEGNPWRCDEALCGVLDAVVGGALWGARPVPVCAAPPSLAAKSWPELPQHFNPYIMILDSNQYWVRAGRTTSVRETHNVTLQCRYCFVSRVTWALNNAKLPRSFLRTSHKVLISSLTMENIHKEDQGNYMCQVNDCAQCDTARLHVTVNTTITETRGL